MMNPNSMNGAEDQQVKQFQQLRSNQAQMNIPGQQVAAMEGMQKVQELSAAQKAQKGLKTGVSLGVYALKGKDSELGRMSDPNYAAFKMASVPEQALLRERLKGLA